MLCHMLCHMLHDDAAWASKCGFITAKASRPDMYRAANHILRMAVEGRLRLCLAPPNYFQQLGQCPRLL